MRRAIASGLAVLLAAVLAGAAGNASGAASSGPSLTARAFSADAEGFPIEPGFGAQQFAVPLRPAGTRASVANAPISAYARSSFVDLGPAELYTGPPPAGSFAECDTTRSNIPLSASAAPGTMTLQVLCDRRPASRASADDTAVDQAGVKARRVSSRTVADGGGDTLAAAADSALSDGDVGPVHVGSAHFHAEVRADGRPGGAAATGTITVSDSTVDGVPVVFGPDGVQVDKNKVPLELVPAAADAVHSSLSQGGYSNVRLVQPQAAAAPDGTKASVSGGGLQFLGSSNDPQNNYFVTLTLVGGNTAVALGAPLTVTSDQSGTPPAPAPPLGSVPESVAAGANLFSPPSGGVAAAPSAPAIQPRLVGTRGRYDLPRAWSGWVWLLLCTAAVAAGAFVARRPLSRSLRQISDRYVRG